MAIKRTGATVGIEILGQTRTYEGETTPMLMWTNGFNILRTLTEMGNELKRFKVFSSSAKEGQVADWDSVIGKPCSVQVVHRGGDANIKRMRTTQHRRLCMAYLVGVWITTEHLKMTLTQVQTSLNRDCAHSSIG